MRPRFLSYPNDMRTGSSGSCSLLVFLPLILAFLALTASAGRAEVWTVLPDGSGDAPTIAAAVDSAMDGDTVEIGCGTYFEHGIAVSKAIAIRSENGSAGCVTINAQRRDRIFFIHGTPGPVVLEGLTLLNGGAASQAGGGVSADSVDLTIQNCSFLFCESHQGGGLFVWGGTASIQTSVFADCSADDRGGGAYFLRCDNLSVSNSTFSRNYSPNGGGMAIRDGSPVFQDVLISENSASTGGGVFVSTGTAGSYPDFRRCRLVENYASANGGAMRSTYAAPSMFGCLVARNSAVDNGSLEFYGGTATIHESTIAHNEAEVGAGGIRCIDGCVVLISNSIIAFNQRFSLQCSNAAPPSVVCTDVFGNELSNWDGCLSGLLGLYGNISEDPQFCQADPLDYTINLASPCHSSSSNCGQMGAYGEGCSPPVATESVSWGALKVRYLK